MSDTGLLYRIALAHYRNITVETARRLSDKGISPDDFFKKSAATLAACTGVKSAFFDEARRADALEQARREMDFINARGLKAIYYTDADYPQRLLECGDAPAMLYVAGDASVAAARHCVAVVGTRHCTAYGADFTRRLVADLAASLDSLLIISGLAYGIDICAHRAALEAGVPTAAVLAHGLNTVYPADHRNEARRILADGGFVATEYRSVDTVHRGNFLARNRIVAGLTDVTVVVESDLRGGAMATARIAGDYNREVMAVPGRVGDTYSRGCNHLIASRRALLLRGAEDLVDAMQWTARPAPGSQQEMRFEVPEQYARVLEALSHRPDATVNDLCVALDMPFASLSATLFSMEMEDYIVSLPGGRYTLPAR